MSDYRRPAGITALSILFAFGAFMSGVSAVLQLYPNSLTDQGASTQTASGAELAVLLASIVCVACIVASAGLWRLARWGLWTAIGILGANVVGDAISSFSSPDWRTLIQVPIAGFMIWYLLRQRPQFEGSGQPTLPAEDQSAHTSA